MSGKGNEAMLQIRNLHASVEGKPILNGVDLTLDAGQVHADAQQASQFFRKWASPRRAEGHWGSALRYCLRSRTAAGKAALAALGAREEGLDLLRHRVAFHFQVARGHAEEPSKRQAQGRETGDCCKHVPWAPD